MVRRVLCFSLSDQLASSRRGTLTLRAILTRKVESSERPSKEQKDERCLGFSHYPVHVYVSSLFCCVLSSALSRRACGATDRLPEGGREARADHPPGAGPDEHAVVGGLSHALLGLQPEP